MKQKMSVSIIIVLFSQLILAAQTKNIQLEERIHKLIDSVDMFNKQARFRKSIEYTNNAINLSKELGDNALIIKSQWKLAEVHIRMLKPKRAILIIQDLIDDTNNYDYQNEIADLYCLQALAYKELNEFDNVEYYLRLSLDISRKNNYRKGQRVALINLGILNYNLKEYKIAQEYFEKAEAYSDVENLDSISFYFYFALTKIELKDFKQALYYLDSAFTKDNNKIKDLKSICLAYVMLYEYQNNFEKVVFWHKKYVEYETTFHDELNKKNEETLRLTYDLKIKDKEIQIAHTEKQIREEKINRFNIVICFIVFVLIGFMFVIIIIHKKQLKEQELNIILSEKNQELLIAKEKVETLSKVKSNFFSMISHELRTPLYTITGITELLIKNKANNEDEKLLKPLKFAGNHLISLVNNILQNNKIENREFELHLQSFNLLELLNNIVATFEYYINKSNNKIHLDFDSSISKFIYGDSVKLSQILNNLLSNALKFTHNGNVWVTVMQDKHNDNGIFFRVKDDGIGIDLDKQTTIFNSSTQETLDFDRKRLRITNL